MQTVGTLRRSSGNDDVEGFGSLDFFVFAGRGFVGCVMSAEGHLEGYTGLKIVQSMGLLLAVAMLTILLCGCGFWPPAPVL